MYLPNLSGKYRVPTDSSFNKWAIRAYKLARYDIYVCNYCPLSYISKHLITKRLYLKTNATHSRDLWMSKKKLERSQILFWFGSTLF